MKKIFFLLIGLPLILIACINLKNPGDKVEFYTLEYNPPVISDLKPLSHIIRLDRFSVSPIYNTDRIIYRDGSFKRDTYFYHKWRANPGDLVTYFLARDIRASGLFSAVIENDSKLPSSYLVEGSVDEFYERDAEDKWEAVLSIGITLMAEREPDISKRVIFQKTYRVAEPCSQKNPRALIEAMSTAMSKISSDIIKDIYHSLENRD
ncbi:MAG: membrane integrity-associated transporter subunit PqiC [Nitrospinae bacterium]|nr:membrane integrity-associated transporter subunit PqiC [Nitrospinota bacterium]